MLRFLLRRLPQVALVLVATSIIAFLLPRLAPGDPAVALAGEDPDAATIDAIRTQLGLDRPLIVQYLDWIGGILRGDLGTSYIVNRPVSELIGARIESTVELAIAASIVMVVVGLLLGIIGGSTRSKVGRFIVDAVNTTNLALPAFLVALFLILVFGVWYPILPISGEVHVSENFGIGVQYLLLPAVALGLSQSTAVARLLQTRMRTIRGEEFVDLAMAKGASPRRVTYRHVLRNSLGTAVVAMGVRIGEVFGGVVIIEAIFARTGLGQLTVQAVNTRDYLLIQPLILLAVLVAVVSQLVTEMALAGLDPRVRLDD